MSLNEKGVSVREIITKAVIGKGNKFSQQTHVMIPPNTPNSILGCWVINHSYTAAKVGDAVEITGSYDINVWYSYANNSKTDVAKENLSYVERIPLSYLDGNHLRGDEEVKATVTQQPSAVEAKVVDGKCSVTVEKEFFAEMIGETKVCVLVAPGSCGELDEKLFEEGADFGELEDEVLIDELD
ncbi:MAG: outer spore coat protein CotE [Thermicanus sp.]|nr:outer spore coat protein CotE [Thermicanus sp.]